MVKLEKEQVRAVPVLGQEGLVEVNLNENDNRRPGTAAVWLGETKVFTAVKCRAQVINMGNFAIINIYAPLRTYSWAISQSFFSTSSALPQISLGLP